MRNMRFWIMPRGSEVLGTDGAQLWYADEDGAGTTTDLGALCSDISFTVDPSDAPRPQES